MGTDVCKNVKTVEVNFWEISEPEKLNRHTVIKLQENVKNVKEIFMIQSLILEKISLNMNSIDPLKKQENLIFA